jgi:hypothetical protein
MGASLDHSICLFGISIFSRDCHRLNFFDLSFSCFASMVSQTIFSRARAQMH